MSKYFLKLALMNKRGEGKFLFFFLHEVIRKQDMRTCYMNLKRSTCTDVKTGWVHYRGFHAGRNFKWKKFSLSILIIFGLHERLICFIIWIQGGLCLYTPKNRSVIQISSSDCKVPLSESLGVSSEYRTEEWKMLLSFLMTWSLHYACLGGGKDCIFFGKWLWVPWTHGTK